MSDERSRFESWFQYAYGTRPEGDADCLNDQIAELRCRVRHLQRWDAAYQAALDAWIERHSHSPAATPENPKAR